MATSSWAVCAEVQDGLAVPVRAQECHSFRPSESSSCPCCCSLLVSGRCRSAASSCLLSPAARA